MKEAEKFYKNTCAPSSSPDPENRAVLEREAVIFFPGKQLCAMRHTGFLVFLPESAFRTKVP